MSRLNRGSSVLFQRSRRKKSQGGEKTQQIRNNRSWARLKEEENEILIKEKCHKGIYSYKEK